MRRINANNRTQTVINCEIIGGTHFKDCQLKFNEINLCKLPNVMLPQKIKLYLTKDLFDFDKYPFISSIVDTRGVDSVFSGENKMKREDILDYIDKGGNDCLFFFVDNIKPAPSQSITELLRTRVSTNNEFRYYLLLNIYGNEAEEVMTDDGKAGTARVGIEYKREDISDKFKQLRIRFMDDNLLFYNARFGGSTNTDILSCIECNLSNQIIKFYELCNEIKSAYEESKTNLIKDISLFEFLSFQKIAENSVASPNTVGFIFDSFIEDYGSVHHARMHAINRCYGDHWAFPYYHRLSLIAEILFDKFFLDSKEKIIEKAIGQANSINLSKMDELNYKAFLNKFDENYGKYRSQLKEQIQYEIENQFSTASWKASINEWGKGSGYKNRVRNIHSKELLMLLGRMNLTDRYNSKWETIFEESSAHWNKNES